MKASPPIFRKDTSSPKKMPTRRPRPRPMKTCVAMPILRLFGGLCARMAPPCSLHGEVDLVLHHLLLRDGDRNPDILNPAIVVWNKTLRSRKVVRGAVRNVVGIDDGIVSGW